MSDTYTGLTNSQVMKLMTGFFLSGDVRDNLYLEGHHGIGKTDMIVQAAIAVWGTAEQRKMPVEVLLRMTDEERGWVLRRE